MPLMITNTMNHEKVELVPREPGRIDMYVCGPTVYNHIHIGNARMAIVFDVIRRYLVWRGYKVTFVMNYTDVDDRIIATAAQEGRSTDEVAATYAEAFEDVTARLGIKPPDRLVRATEHIDDMIAMIEKLITRGFAYEAEGNVWFEVEKFDRYGRLSRRSLDDLRKERIEPDPSKRNPVDFSLWKAAKPGEPSWPSPWGDGRPGWHIECSAMSSRYLGMGFDIHAGGSDLVFPHHENEIAQAEAASGEEPFARYWMHNGMVNIDEQKMSKSLGNFVFAKDLLEHSSPPVLRFMSIAAHYRNQVDFSEGSLVQAKRTIEKIAAFLRAADESGVTDAGEGEPSEFVGRFTEAMDDDFNTPVAIGVLHELIRVGHQELPQVASNEEAATRVGVLVRDLRELCGILGIAPEDSPSATDGIASALIELLIELRRSAREAGRYEDADVIRARLSELGVTLEDAAGGTRWHWS